MDTFFWRKRWETNEIGFHENKANPLLTNNFYQLNIAQSNRVFVPLCGKTLDIGWLLANGYSVVGAELSELAIKQLFTDLGLEAQIKIIGTIKHYYAPKIDIFVGNIFELNSQILGPIDAVFDRAALVALPEKMRIDYSQHLMNITTNAPQLLITFEYDQTLMEGPPFSITEDEVHQHYAGKYAISSLECVDVVGGLKGVLAATETVWHLMAMD